MAMMNPFPLPDKCSPTLQRVFSYWQSLERGETNMPFWDDVKLSALPDLADRLLLLCFHYDPATGKYGLAILRVIRVLGVVMVLGMAATVLVFLRRERRARTASREVEEATA